MGIQFFSKVFCPYNKIKLKELSKKIIAIDAMTEIYRAALGSKSVGLLTDKNGNNTMHINVIMANIIEMQKLGIETIWVFDHVNITPEKVNEVIKRKQRKEEAKEKLSDIKLQELKSKERRFKLVADNNPTEEILLDDESFIQNINDEPIIQNINDEPIIQNINDEPIIQNIKESSDIKENIKKKKDQLEKQTFSVDKSLIDDVKFILDCFSIKYIESPEGFEAEQIAAYLSQNGKCDGVYSGDTDPIAFGSKFHFRKSTKDKIIYCYSQEDILQQISKETKTASTLNDIQKICVILGCDFAKKTPKIGPKTVISKYKNVVLTEEQKNAIKFFNKEAPAIDIIHKDNKAFENHNGHKLYSWLVDDKSFNPIRVRKWLEKVNIVVE
jgi:hypothetical protein